jgi:drug/metabolite transporter (DMT)-like permease
MTAAGSATAAMVPAWAGGGLRSPVLVLALAALFWSGNFIAGRALRGQIDPLTLNFARWLLALALIAPFVWQGAMTSFHVLRREWRLILSLGATGIAMFHTLVYMALKSTTATNALMILSLAPIVTLFGAVAIGMEQATRRQLVGASVSVIGAGVLISRGKVATILTEGFNAGDLWMLLAVVVWASYSLLLRRRPTNMPSSVALAASIVAALALMAPLLIIRAPTCLSDFESVSLLLSIGYIAIFASAIAFLLWSYRVSRLGPARAGQFLHLMPVFGAGLAVLLLGELPTPTQIAGALLVLSGIAIVERRPRQNGFTG